jgi:peptide/nickel transport system substrate-binding protein
MNNSHLRVPFSRRHFLQLAGGSVALIALSACAPAAPAVPAPVADAPDTTLPQRGGTLRVVFSDDLTTLDPATPISATDVATGFLLYNTLLRRSEGEAGAPLYPELAESWEINEDATMHTFYLRQDVVFQHGTAFTAKDVEYSINRLLDPTLGSGMAANLGAIDRMEILDDFTIAIHLAEPNVTLPYSSVQVQIVPHDRTTEELRQEATGTGPFVLAERVSGERIVFKRNENYWDSERPYLDEVALLTIPEPATQTAALTGGTVDFLFTISLETMPLLENAPDVSILESSQGVYPVFVMRADQAPFDDLRVRQAFKHAIDRNALHTGLMLGLGTVGNDQPVGPGTPFWADVQPLAYDVETAKVLLAEAGYADGLEVTLVTADIGGPRLNDAAVAIQEMVKAAGITVTLEKVPVGAFYAEHYMQTPFFVSWWPVFSDPNGVLPLAYSSAGVYNESGWSDPRADELIIAARGELDFEKRKAMYAEVQKMISEQGGVIVPYVAPYLQATRSNVHGHIPGPRIVFQNIWLA